MDDCRLLKSDKEGVEKPVNMLQQNCQECHTSIISYYKKFDLYAIDTIKSNDKFVHTWIICLKNDSLQEIQILAKGINRNNDTLPVKKAIVLVAVQRYFGWMPVNRQPLLTDDHGLVSCQLPADIKGDSTGRFRILIKLINEKSYPNGKLKMNLSWGEPLYEDTQSNNKIFSAGFGSLPGWLSFTALTGALTICIIIGYIFYLIFRIEKTGKKTKPL